MPARGKVNQQERKMGNEGELTLLIHDLDISFSDPGVPVFSQSSHRLGRSESLAAKDEGDEYLRHTRP
jgi:hypothetical protein